MANGTIKKTASVNETIYTATNVSIAASARTHIDFDTSELNGAKIIGIVPIQALNDDWVQMQFRIQATNVLRAYLHNEYTGALSGTIEIRVAYI